MFQRTATLAALAAAMMIAAMAPAAYAGDRMHRHQAANPTHSAGMHNMRHRHRLHRGVDTYSGDVAIYFRRNVGTWSYGSLGRIGPVVSIAPNARIIDVSKLGADANCQMEMGVCVIRP